MDEGLSIADEGQKRAGNQIIDRGKIVIVPEWATVVQEIFQLAAVGVGSAKISERLNGRGAYSCMDRQDTQ